MSNNAVKDMGEFQKLVSISDIVVWNLQFIAISIKLSNASIIYMSTSGNPNEGDFA